MLRQGLRLMCTTIGYECQAGKYAFAVLFNKSSCRAGTRPQCAAAGPDATSGTAVHMPVALPTTACCLHWAVAGVPVAPQAMLPQAGRTFFPAEPSLTACFQHLTCLGLLATVSTHSVFANPCASHSKYLYE